MSEGNPGAAMVLQQILSSDESIDPDSAFGNLGSILTLDQCEVYGSKIWVLYKDICDQDIVKTRALLRCVQMGIAPESSLFDKHPGMDSFFDRLREELPNYNY